MKEMVYKYDENLISQKREVLAEGTYGEYKYIVMSHSLYPAVYIDLPDTVGERLIYGGYTNAVKQLNRTVPVHGGWEYVSETLCTNDRGYQFRRGWFVGWTYNTDDDFIAGEIFSNHKDGKKWTTAELVEEAKTAILKLIAHEEDLK
jgi:hypothetical protein